MTDAPAAAGTPRVDAVLADIQSRYLSSAETRMHEFAAFARILERELSACRAELAASELGRQDANNLISVLEERGEVTRDLLRAELDTVRAAKEKSERLLAAAEKDAERWRSFVCPQTALMLGSKLDPNDTSVDWLDECNILADAALASKDSTK